MNGTKHILILLSLTLCFGNVSGQVLQHSPLSKPTNLVCDVNYGNKDESHILDLMQFKIWSPKKLNDSGLSVKGKVMINNSDQGYIEPASYYFTSGKLEIEEYGSIDRKTLEIKTIFLFTFQCEIVSDQRMSEIDNEKNEYFVRLSKEREYGNQF